jgi:asparagine synthetase B (glutamine-hydrolysing)
MSVLRIIPSEADREDPDKLIARAVGEHRPVAVWCLFSGGNDSTVLAHRCREHYQGLAFVDTGTAVPGVAEFVREYAEWRSSRATAASGEGPRVASSARYHTAFLDRGLMAARTTG